MLKEVQTGSCKLADLEGGVEEEEDLGVGQVLNGTIEMWFPSLPLALLLLAGVSRGPPRKAHPKAADRHWARAAAVHRSLHF